MIAHETASTVRWNAATSKIPGNPPAAGLLKREYRGHVVFLTGRCKVPKT